MVRMEMSLQVGCRIGQKGPVDRLPGLHGGDGLEPGLCRVVGLNENYVSGSGTPYHIQIEDRGPVVDKLTRHQVRRVNVVVYANYGEPNARIIHGCDHDYPDIRTHEHNAFIGRELHEQAAAGKSLIEERERRKIDRLKRQIRQYYLSRSEPIKREFVETNALYPFLFSRAWQELRSERVRPAGTPAGAGVFSGARYPADRDLREHVLEIERIIISIGQDMARLKAGRGAEEALLRTCGETVAQARAALAGRDKAEFNPRRLVLIRNTLLTTWRRVHSQLER
jgi:hypothetical protein